MANVIPAAPVKAFPVVVAGMTGPTGPAASMVTLAALQEAVQVLTARVAALEEKLR
jgi:hypothetical protein